MAAHLGISRQMYIKYENGEVEPPVNVIIKLCRMYKVDYADVIENKLKPAEYEYKIPKPKPLVLSDSGGNLTSMNYLQAYSYACELKYDELFMLLSKIVKLMEKKKEKPTIRKMTREESLAAFERFSGCIKKDYTTADYREMWYEYLDERYNGKEIKDNE